MKLRPVARPIPLEVPAIIAKRATGGAGWRGADEYASGKDGAELLSASLEGKTPRERSREIARLLVGSRIKRHCDHWSLSVDPRLGKLSDDQWRHAAEVFLERMTYQGCAYTLTRHVDTKVDHCHLLVLRRRGDGTTVSDSNDFKRGHAAAIAAAGALGLKPLPPRPDSARLPAATNSQVNANRMAKARGAKVNHSSLARIFNYAVSKSTDLKELESVSREAGLGLQIVRKSGGEIQGLNVKFTGAEAWCKASELKTGSKIERPLAWAKVEARLAQNAALRERAQAQATQVGVDARERAGQRVAARLDRQPEPVSQPARAMLPEAANQAKEATMNDALDFLNAPPSPRPADVPLDDAGLTPFALLASAEAEAGHKKKLKTEQEDRDRDQAKLEVLDSVKRMTITQLLDLRSHGNVPPVVLSVAALEALVNLAIRLLSFGVIRRTNTLAASLAARERLREYAEEELTRRRRTPGTVSERKAALSDYAQAIQERSEALGARQSNRKAAALHRDRAAEAAALRAQLEAGLDRRQVARAQDTVKTRRAAHADARAEHRRVRAENDRVPAGFGGFLISKATRDAAAAAKVAEALVLKNAAERRAATKHQLQLLLDEIEEAALKHEQEAAEQAAAVEKAEAFERDALARELRALPEQLREIGAAAQRVQHRERAVELVAEHNRTKTPAELEAVEAERLRQLELANRRG